MAIHGIEMEKGPALHAVYDRCVPRLAELFDAESIRATFFAIGSDLGREHNRDTVASLHEAGHEIGNHSFHHHYDLSRRSVELIRQDIELGASAIHEACGVRPVGFRAPGYTITDAMFDVLERSEVVYDSSVFPCPSYYATKVSVLGWMALRGRTSASIVDTPWVLRSPRQPYRVGRPYWRKGAGLLELPIGVTPWGLPFIGTSVVVAGDRSAKTLTRRMLARDFVHLELHGFDVADITLDGLEALAPHRPDLKRSAAEKLLVIRSVIDVIRKAGYEFVPLKEVAGRLSEKPSP
jgi:peptidoglycan/xylan/chitin deacetylase (PgdA/CDA1 family)